MTAASATISLPPGHYRWQVRALPDGEWTPTVGLVTGFASRRWQPSKIVATFASRSTPRLSITAQLNRDVTIAWAAESGVCGAWVGRPLSTDAQPARGSNWEEERLWSNCRRLAIERPGWPTEAALALQTMPGAISATAWAGEWEMGSSMHRDAAVAVDAFGNAQVVWVAESGGTSILAATRQANGEWDIPIRVSGASTDIHANPAVAVDSRGAVYAAWQRQAGCSDQAASADIEFAWRPAGGDWQPASVVSRDIGGISLSAPALAAGADGAAYLAWEELIAGRYMLFSSYRPAGGAWEEKMVIPDAATGLWEPTEPALAVDSAGNAYVAWLERRDDLVAVRISASVE